jgi:hypothetical protein
MKIEIVVDPSRPASLAQRVAPAATPVAAAVNTPKTIRLVSCIQSTFVDHRTLLIMATCSRRTGGGPRGRGRGGKARRAGRPVVSAADLDAEMEVGL